MIQNILLNKYSGCAIAIIALIFFSSCKQSSSVDLIVTNGVVYTVDSNSSMAEAIAITDGKIIAIGTNDELMGLQGEGTEVIDAGGNFIMPGFIEGHGHFPGLGMSLQDLNFLKSRSWQEIVDAVAEKVETAKPGEWIIGRGWHQEKWQDTLMNNVLGYPYHNSLSAISPDNPVMLVHASGHGLFANAYAMKIAGLTSETATPSGGNIVRSPNGEAIGMFEENAMAIVRDAYSEYQRSLSAEEIRQKWYEGIALAEKECLKKGVTSFQDAGSSLMEIEGLRKLAEEGELDLRLWAMIRHESEYLNGKLDDYPVIDAGDGFFTCRGIKLSIDGALGSYGAWLLEPYDDNPGFYGQNTKSIEELNARAQMCIDNGMQFCVHAIGDRANREVLDAFEAQFKDSGLNGPDLRWRIEHAQHIHPDDIPRFAELGVIASMQGVHCTSDAPYVVKRLGTKRASDGAYVWKSLLEAGAVVTNGTDAPVEDVDPIESFYATVTRKRVDTGLEFFTAQALTREEAIYSYTMANAFAAFEEDVKGSLEPGKYADLVILSRNLLTCSDEQILDTQILMTMIDGQIAYQDENF